MGRELGPAGIMGGRRVVTGALGHLKSSSRSCCLARVPALPRGVLLSCTGCFVQGAWEGSAVGAVLVGCRESQAGCHLLPVLLSLVLHGHNPVGHLPAQCAPRLARDVHSGLQQGPEALGCMWPQQSHWASDASSGKRWSS